jgi:hypothetical protein
MADEDPLDEAIDRWMRERASPAAPGDFTAGVMARLSQERWRAERYWDVGFNVAIGGGLLLIAAGVVGLIYLSGLSVVGRDALELFVQGLTTVANQVAPMLPMYVAAFVLTATALGLWWYVES